MTPSSVASVRRHGGVDSMTPLRLTGWVLVGVGLLVAVILVLAPPQVEEFSCGSVLAPVQQPASAPLEVGAACNDLRAGRFLWALGVGLAGFALFVYLVVDRVRATAPRAPSNTSS